jgi:hypothetical protein
MTRNDAKLWIPLFILFFIGIAGFWAPNYVPAFAKIANEQWLGFFGSLIGAAVTLVAAIIAWFAVQGQIKTTERLAELERHRKAKGLAILVENDLAVLLGTVGLALESDQGINADVSVPPDIQRLTGDLHTMGEVGSDILRVIALLRYNKIRYGQSREEDGTLFEWDRAEFEERLTEIERFLERAIEGVNQMLEAERPPADVPLT